MSEPSDFWRTRGKSRYAATLARYRAGEIGAKSACEYLAELLLDSGELDDDEARIVADAHLLVHDSEDGMVPVSEQEFEQLLRS